MNSSIDHLIRHLVPSLASISPDKTAELQSLIDKFGVIFVFDDQTTKMMFAGAHADNTITIGLKALERLWVRAYAYSHLYDFITKQQIHSPGVALDLDHTRDPAVCDAMTLLAWTVDVEQRLYNAGRNGSPGDLSWPADLPHPDPHAARGSMKHIADELFLCAIGAVLHHEMAHFRFGHDARALASRNLTLDEKDDMIWQQGNHERIQWEKQADAWSAEWLLDGLDIRDDKFLKRVLGLALGYLWSASRNIHTGDWRRPNYPPAWDRFYQTIKQHVPDSPLHPIWMFSAYIIQLHLQANGIAASPTVVETPEAWANNLLDYLSRNY